MGAYLKNVHRITILMLISLAVLSISGCLNSTNATENDDGVLQNEPIISVSPDGKYRAEAFGTITEITAGGLFPYKGVRIISVDKEEVIWKMEPGGYTVSFTWSPDCKYVGIYYTGRIWGESIVVDVNEMKHISLPELDEVASHYDASVKPQEDRPDPYFEIQGWKDSETVIVNFRWTKADGDEFSGWYTFNVKTNEAAYYEHEAADIPKDIARIEFWSDSRTGYSNDKTVTDSKIINDIAAMIEESRELVDETKMSKLGGLFSRRPKIIVIGTDGSQEEIVYDYSSLYELGYIEIEGKKFEPDFKFFRYISGLKDYANFDPDIEPQVIELFARYNWTVNYKINTLNEKLPDNLKHKAGEYPEKIYWAYNNELSKQIGLDFSGYLGEDVVAEIFGLREPLPEFMKPMTDARGVILF